MADTLGLILCCLIALTLNEYVDDENVRLVDKDHRCDGRIEVLKNGKWGTVCHTSWYDYNSAVICSELGCGSYLRAYYFPAQSGDILLSGVECTDKESSLLQCKSDPQVHETCTHRKDVRQECSGDTASFAGGLCYGQLELNLYKTKGAVCFNNFDSKAAAAVCQELRCGVLQGIQAVNYKGEEAGQKWTEEFLCKGGEKKLAYCPRRKKKDSNYVCDKVVSIICYGYTDYRLSNGCSGRVELEHDGAWSTVCEDDWDIKDASVLCHQLKCGYAVEISGHQRSDNKTGQIVTDIFNCEGNERELSRCQISTQKHSKCSLKKDASITCSAASGHIRLVGGQTRCDGRVEIFYNRVWGRLLRSSLNQREASAVCEKLDCGYAIHVYSSSRYGVGDSDTCFGCIHCTSKKGAVVNCTVKSADCKSGEDVGLLCSKHTALRLVGGGGDCAGRLEVYYNGTWGTVCDDSWDLIDANVACKQLQCGHAIRTTDSFMYGQGTGPVWLDDVSCDGNESTLWQCNMKKWGDHNCKHKEDVGILCSEFKELRLVSNEFDCAGRPEVFYNGTWGLICSNGMEGITASVICHHLNCGDSGFVSVTAAKSPAIKWLDEVKCNHHHTSLWQCPALPWGVNNCADEDVSEIVCSGKRKKENIVKPCSNDPSQQRCLEPESLRLIGGPHSCAGRVEVLHQDVWGTVCDDSWDLADAQVVCRHVGCGEAVSVHSEASFGSGNDSIWLDEVNCKGGELRLWDCQHASLGIHNCHHKEDAGVICAVPKEVQLVQGTTACSGRVEILYGDTWGTVCDDSWDLKDAQVVCRQVGCGTAQSRETRPSFGQGNGTIWLNKVACSGTEDHLWDCQHSLLRQNNCTHEQDVGVICADISKSTSSNAAQNDQSILMIVCFILGALLFVTLILIFGQYLQKKDLRRQIEEWEVTYYPQQDMYYEEIEYKLGRTYSLPRKGSMLYDNISYDDVMNDYTDNFASGDIPYDDVVDENAESIHSENLPFNYDDVKNKETD